MIKTSKIHSIFAIYLVMIVITLFGVISPGRSQENIDGGSISRKTLIKSVKFGGHPTFTRILVDLDKITPYRIKPDLKNNTVTLTMVNTDLAPEVRSKSYKDQLLNQIDVLKERNAVRIKFGFKDNKIQIFHFADTAKSQIILDFKLGRTSISTAQTKSKVNSVKESPNTYFSELNKSTPPTKKIHSSEESSSKRNELEKYQEALKVYQKQNYPNAIKAFNKFKNTFPKSKYLAQISFLIAEAEYNLATMESPPDYEKALNAYKFAMRQYPDSNFRDHSLYKIARIYEKIDHTLEAKNLYKDGIKSRRKSRYTASRETGLAKMLLNEGKLSESYAAFLRILKKTPENKEAKSSVLKIGQKYFERENFDKALKIFEKGAVMWPESLNENPHVSFQMAEIYLSKKQYDKARKHYFNLINLTPADNNAHIALNKIGDTYIHQKNYKAALSVFHKSYKMNPQSNESRYGQIRLADIGILDPSLPVRDIVFDVKPYVQPFNAFSEVKEGTKAQNILAEATLSQGLAHLNSQDYLSAIEQFKMLLAFDKKSRFYLQAKKFIRQSIVFLIQKYADQKGSLPILYAYSDYLTLSLGELKNMKTLLQIGESYKDIGMNNEALEFFEKVKLLDVTGVYTERLFLNLGQIHLNEGNYKEAEIVSISFLNKYPKSHRKPEVMKLLAASFQKRKQFDIAMNIYLDLLQVEGADTRETHYLIAELQFAKSNLNGSEMSYQNVIRGFDRSIKNPAEHIKTSFYKTGIVQHKLGKVSKALHSLKIARLLFPDHPLNSWADYLIADGFKQLSEEDNARQELKIIVNTEPNEGLIYKAAESRLKILDWEKNIKNRL
ncbi:MAG: tetratricopeptide repeat protein [Nitrospinales bacterium]